MNYIEISIIIFLMFVFLLKKLELKILSYTISIIMLSILLFINEMHFLSFIILVLEIIFLLFFKICINNSKIYSYSSIKFFKKDLKKKLFYISIFSTIFLCFYFYQKTGIKIDTFTQIINKDKSHSILTFITSLYILTSIRKEKT